MNPRASGAGMSKPLFVVVEGLDGSGKSTLARSLSAALGAVHIQTPLKELVPGDGGISSALRESIDSIVSISPSARLTFYMSLVLAANVRVMQLLGEGKTVVCDRWLLSTLAYGHAMGSRLLLWDAVYQTRQPDVTIIVEAPLAVRRIRIEGRVARGGELTRSDRWSMVDENNAKLEAAYSGAMACEQTCGRIIRLQSSGRAPNQVLEAALAEVQWQAV